MFDKRIFVITFVLFLGFILIMGGCTLLPPPTPTTYTITSTAGENGQIDPEGEVTITEGGNQAFTINADEGYQIDDVLVDDESVGAVGEYTFTNVQKNHTISASFTQLPSPPITQITAVYYNINATAGEGGSIKPEGSIKIKKGSSRIFTINADEGYQIDDVLVDDESVGAVGEYTFTNVQKNHTISAIFVLSTKPEWLGDPQCIPDVIYTSESTNVRFHVLVNKKSDDLASESPVKLFKREGNTSWVLLDEMFDDGDLDNHGDEIKGDRVYSNIIEFYEESAVEIPLKIVVTTSDTQQYSVKFNLSTIEDMTEKIIKDTEELSVLAEEKVIEIMQSPPPDLAGVIQILSDYLAELPYVESCEIFGDNIWITFDTGVLMEIRLINLDEEEPLEGANIAEIEKNLKLSNNINREEEYIPIPIENQTTGGDGFVYNLSKETNTNLISKDGSEIEYIGNRDVFVFDPFYTYWTKWDYDVGNTYKELLDIGNSGIEFNIKIYRDYQADIEILKTISDYGIVIIHTHGSGSTFATGLEATEANKGIYNDEMKKEEVYISKHLAVSWKWLGLVKVYEDKLGVRRSWFNSTNFPEKLPNSIIFNNSCKNGNKQFYKAFDSIGAATYYGHSDNTTRSNAIECTTEVLEGLIDGKTTGEAYVPRSSWEIFPDDKDNVKIPISLPFSNGGFEEGFLNWKKEGDGRIITGLAFLEPTEGSKMAIVSTGLGYTDKYGSISQTFTAGNNDTTLEFDWNYLSEEFLEFIDSIYQDPFKVTLTKVDGSLSETLLYKTVDSIAADFGATQDYGGDLISVSPDIVFDVDDVWMTNWQTFQCDISEFQGDEVTIKFEAEDLGDEIYDTVILLDNIKIY